MHLAPGLSEYGMTSLRQQIKSSPLHKEILELKGREDQVLSQAYKLFLTRCLGAEPVRVYQL